MRRGSVWGADVLYGKKAVRTAVKIEQNLLVEPRGECGVLKRVRDACASLLVWRICTHPTTAIRASWLFPT